jgi:hypothetical protein
MTRILSVGMLCVLLCAAMTPGMATAASPVSGADIEPGVATSSAAAPVTAPPPAAAPKPAAVTPAAPVPAVTTPTSGAATVDSSAMPAPGTPTSVADSTAPVADATAAAGTDAAPPAPAEGTKGLDEQIQGLKSDVIDLNTELFSLEEELLYPANTQVAVFVSMDVGEFFALDSVTVKIDDKEVSNYLYTPREVNALLQGGVQRMYVGNLKAGQHELVAFFTGKGPNDRDYKRGATIKFEKSIGAKYLELKITDRASKLQPEFAIRDWE